MSENELELYVVVNWTFATGLSVYGPFLCEEDADVFVGGFLEKDENQFYHRLDFSIVQLNYDCIDIPFGGPFQPFRVIEGGLKSQDQTTDGSSSEGKEK